MKAAICIITFGRKAAVTNLVLTLGKQLGSSDSIVLVENGPKLMKQQDLDTFRSLIKNFKYIYSKEKSIPKARNVGFNWAKKSHDLLIYLDDDCLPEEKWFRNFKKATKSSAATFIQGSVTSYPRNNVYAVTTGSLYNSWIKANITKKNQLSLADTKNLGIRLKKVNHLQNLFNEKYRYASDIEMWCRLSKQFGPTFFEPSIKIKHFERATLTSFIKHRIRLAQAFRQVVADYPGQLQSSNLKNKTVNLLKDLSDFPLVVRFWMLGLVGLTTFYVLLGTKK